MDKRIIYPNDDGGVSIIIPAPEARKKIIEQEAVIEIQEVEIADGKKESKKVIVSPEVSRMQTDEEFLQYIAEKDVPSGKPYKVIDVADIPTDRTFRDAWEYQ